MGRLLILLGIALALANAQCVASCAAAPPCHAQEDCPHQHDAKVTALPAAPMEAGVMMAQASLDLFLEPSDLWPSPPAGPILLLSLRI